ncbi:MAG: hypothetical protein AB7O44_28930 [Hyphomicrobiaceae bacterium]
MTTATRKPAFTAYAVSGEGKNAFWTRIGSAWQQNHGEGFNIDLHALPVNGRIILLPPKAEGDQVEGEGAR